MKITADDLTPAMIGKQAMIQTKNGNHAGPLEGIACRIEERLEGVRVTAKFIRGPVFIELDGWHGEVPGNTPVIIDM